MKAFQTNPPNAFTVVELLIVMAAVAILAAMLLPAMYRPRRWHGPNCVNNLKQIGLAFKLWSGDNGNYPMRVSMTNGGTMEMANRGIVFVNFLVMSNELSTPNVLFCPEETDAAKKAAATFEQGFTSTLPFKGDNNVSYFVGVDAEDGLVSQRLLSGDWNLAVAGVPVKHGLYDVRTNIPLSWARPRHNKGGNIGLADGSVQQVAASGLQSLLIQTGVATNRLAIP